MPTASLGAFFVGNAKTSFAPFQKMSAWPENSIPTKIVSKFRLGMALSSPNSAAYLPVRVRPLSPHSVGTRSLLSVSETLRVQFQIGLTSRPQAVRPPVCCNSLHSHGLYEPTVRPHLTIQRNKLLLAASAYAPLGRCDGVDGTRTSTMQRKKPTAAVQPARPLEKEARNK